MAGRCISGDFFAHASYRVTGNAVATGEAAGVLAAVRVNEPAEAVEFLLNQLSDIPWTGSVVMAKGDKIYVNRGTREGVAPGQRFVVGEVEVIRDPDTGEVLDEDMTQIATLEATEVKEKLAICSVTSGDAGAIAKGMAIHLP